MITFDMEKIYITSIHYLALPMSSSGRNRDFSRGHDGKHLRVFS